MISRHINFNDNYLNSEDLQHDHHTLSSPKCFLLYINDLESHFPLYKYVDDSTLFDICNTNYKIQDTHQFIGNHVGWIVIYIIHNTIQAS